MKQILYILVLCIFPFVFPMSNGKHTETLLRDSSNQFTARMFHEVINLNPKKSVVLSGLSAMTPLAELSLASVGESHDELLAAVGTPDDVTTKAVFSYANEELKSMEGVTLKTANKIYIGSNYEIKSDFAAVSRDIFDVEIQNIDFAQNVEASREINNWVEEQTNRRIKNLVSPKDFDESTKSVIINAIYFLGNWEYQFNKTLTEDKDFHVSKNNVIRIPMMQREGYYNYVESEELKSRIIEIPYKGNQVSFVVVLPNNIEGITELIGKLKNPFLLDNALERTSGRIVKVTIPKFKIETTTDLKRILLKMNVKKLFEPNQAKLYNMLKDVNDLYFNSAIQKAFIEVNEVGTEAAVATEFTVLTSGAKPPSVFNADRPFYFAIKAKSFTLFNGVMYGA